MLIKTKCTKCEYLYYAGIYGLWNNKTHKIYVGQTSMRFIHRWLWHESLLKANKDSRYLQYSFNKHGYDAYEWFIIETLPSELECEWLDKNIKPKQKESIHTWLDEREKYWISFYRKILGENNVYNINDGGRFYTYNSYYGKEHKLRLSTITKRRFSNIDERIKQSKRTKEYFKKLFSDEDNYKSFCENIKNRVKNAYETNEKFRINVSNGLKKHYTESGVKEKMSQVQKIAQSKTDTRLKKSKSMSGIKWTNEALENRRQGILNSYKEKRKSYDNILHIVYLVNPKLKSHSIKMKELFINKITNTMVKMNIETLAFNNVYDILENANLLKRRYYRYDLE